MTRPLHLELFCGAGGSAAGYNRAGFDIVGVDLHPQPRFPFEFIQADAIEWLGGLIETQQAFISGGRWRALGDFASIGASPPCQAHTTMSNRWRGAGGKADQHVNLIPETRELLQATGLPYVIENVPGARAFMRSPIVLNGWTMGLPRLDRPRLFETNWWMFSVPRVAPEDPIGVYGKAPDGRRLFTRADGSEQRAAASLEEAQEAMGIDWMTWDELREAIPPAYTEFIGHQLLAHIGSSVLVSGAAEQTE